MIKKKLNNKAAVLLFTVMIITIVSVYLASYSIWTMYEQKNLLRQIQAKKAYVLALAGLQQAKADLALDDNWNDGSINGHALDPSSPPHTNSPDDLFMLYNNVPINPSHPEEGSYTVQIDYLQKPKDCNLDCKFYDNQLLLRSTGTIVTGLNTVSKTLEEIVASYVIKNVSVPPAPIPAGRPYSKLQIAVDETIVSANSLGITETRLLETININAKNVKIKGCYDSDFQFQDCTNYPTIIDGDTTSSPTVNIGSDSDVELSGITIE